MKWDRLPYPHRRGERGDRYALWPIALGWVPRSIGFVCNPEWWQRMWSFTWHGWQTGYEDVPEEQTSLGCMPGKRAVFGQTLHLGFFQVYLGDRSNWPSKRYDHPKGAN
jgi:hypothetical protein